MWFSRITGPGKILDDAEKKQRVWDNIAMLRQYFSGPEDENFVLMEVEAENVEGMSPHQRRPDVFNFKE